MPLPLPPWSRCLGLIGLLFQKCLTPSKPHGTGDEALESETTASCTTSGRLLAFRTSWDGKQSGIVAFQQPILVRAPTGPATRKPRQDQTYFGTEFLPEQGPMLHRKR
ncbi:hypothetical protein M427DRAFT_315235 [Gonapodya prolifera JEL478]|uniref:Secreted protein n=1 Tax=Gonapodya prolifera (strain JEL478) TaxID=1344416 RepID=A0A139AX19_GONPJ|nr:hypothetical protein M427DRAFT_315235 [Gonapodya prolifera JEL478]|eukprot:KXS21270.1 hypothetical protein M427DRAFT_315235 [Gonapodya prolifera JEL478]